MRDYGPGLNDLREALGGVLARSLTDEHFEAYKRASLTGSTSVVARLPSASWRLQRSTNVSTSRAASSTMRSGAAA